MDGATSSDPAVQRELDRLPKQGRGPGPDATLGLERAAALLAALGNPQERLPPVFHVAGTNGKGSTCAFLRAALEAAGHRVHAYTSPHLVRVNERFRVAGTLISDAMLAATLREANDANEQLGASFFEVTTAAAFLAFARVEADACVIEVGLGGRLDATNMVPEPAVCGIAQLGIDHVEFLLNPPLPGMADPMTRIAFEKAGIRRAGVPLVTMACSDVERAGIAIVTRGLDVPVLEQGRDWSFEVGEVVTYRDARGTLALPRPAMAGAHQAGNLALAAAMLRHQSRVAVPDAAIAEAALRAHWPARMQKLSPGPLTALLPAGAEIWLDGGHNAAAADAACDAIVAAAGGRPITLVLGMLANKDANAMLARFAPVVASMVAVPVPGHAHHLPETLVATGARAGIAEAVVAQDVPHALRLIGEAEAGGGVVLILGSLYLAGEVLRLNDEIPD